MIPGPELNWTAVTPILILAVGAMAVLMGEVTLSGRERLLGRPVTSAWLGTVLAAATVVVLALALMVTWHHFAAGTEVVFNLANPMIRLDPLSTFSMSLVLLASILACLLSVAYLSELRIHYGEYYALLLLATSGMLLLVAATDLITLFLGIEILSIPIYVLAGFDRRRLRSNESALKYFLVGSFASALLLYGMALLYGVTGHTDFEGIRAALAGGAASSPLAVVGLGLVLVGFSFKISAVPLHQWTPDVYEGAPTSVTAYMSVTVKVAAFAALLRIVTEGFDIGSGRTDLPEVLWTLAALTMVIGNTMAILQDNVKRMLAYSSVAHAGYVMIGFVAVTQEAYAAVLFYLAVYVFMNLGAFAVVIALARRGEDCDRIEDFAGLARTRPALAGLMTLFMISLAGIPGTAGFIAKFTMFSAAVDAGVVRLTIIAVLTSVVSVYYYLRLPVMMYMREPTDEERSGSVASGEWAVLAVCTFFVIALGIFPNAGPSFLLSWLKALDWSRESVAMLF